MKRQEAAGQAKRGEGCLLSFGAKRAAMGFVGPSTGHPGGRFYGYPPVDWLTVRSVTVEEYERQNEHPGSGENHR